MKDVRWARLARDDLAAINAYYRPIDADIADTMIERIVSATAFLSELPLAGPSADSGRRKWTITRTPYIMFYRVGRDHIRILRVVHAARNERPV